MKHKLSIYGEKAKKSLEQALEKFRHEDDWKIEFNHLNRVNQAIEFALVAHAGQLRKGTDIQYISHPFAVGLLLAKYKCSDDMITAGILHDCLEDTTVTYEEIENKFGADVAKLVEGASEKDRSKSWKSRKQHTIAYLKKSSDEICQVSCADKLHNLMSIIKDFNSIGYRFWERFNAPKEDQVWYYTSLGKVFEERKKQHTIFKEYCKYLNMFIGLIKVR